MLSYWYYIVSLCPQFRAVQRTSEKLSGSEPPPLCWDPDDLKDKRGGNQPHKASAWVPGFEICTPRGWDSNLGKHGPLKGHSEVEPSHGSRIRDPRFGMSNAAFTGADCIDLPWAFSQRNISRGYIYIYIYIHIYTYIHTYIHTYIQMIKLVMIIMIIPGEAACLTHRFSSTVANHVAHDDDPY